MKINPISFIKTNQNISNKKYITPVKSNYTGTKTSYSNLTPAYYKDYMLSFKSKNFNETLSENWFKLPPNCTPDDFQIEAGKAINEGRNVIVEAPTGTGKTVLGYYAASKNMQEGKKTIYTTPLKALSNQKINEFKEKFGEENIGILTGERRENPKAPILIMTTEIYRNMTLAKMYNEDVPIMDNLGTVIFDEMHYMDDEYRGPVWEESVMFTPKDVQMIALSATIGNAPSVKSWMDNTSSKDTKLISVPESSRHVPLVFDSIETESYLDAEKRSKKAKKKNFGYEDYEDTIKRPELGDYKRTVNLLEREQKLPAIFFVFSKKFSREILDYLGQEGKDLTTAEEKEEIEKIYQKYTKSKYIGDDLNLNALRKGYAVHNAGIIPEQKEFIEELFQKKLLKVAIATETLAAGINMPAKTVLISRPLKPGSDKEKTIDSEFERVLTPNEYKQMSGRAGRRGIDDVGYVYKLITDKQTESIFEELQNSECNPIRSKYSPDYAFLTGYYQYNPDERFLEYVYDKSFYVHNQNPEVKKENLKSVMDLTDKKTNVLLERGFLTKQNDTIKLTNMGQMASKVRGYDNLALIETIASGVFKGITPEGLAAVAGMISSPASYKETQLFYGDRLDDVFSDSEDNISAVYERLHTSIEETLEKFGKKYEDFESTEKMLEFANSIEESDIPLDDLKLKLIAVSEIRDELMKINGDEKKYSHEEIAKSLRFGITLSNKTLNKVLEEVEQYKKKNNIKDDFSKKSGYQDGFDAYIEGLTERLAELNDITSNKGKKAQQRYQQEKSEVQRELNLAVTMKDLNTSVVDALAENYQYSKQHSLNDIEKEYKTLKKAYTNTTGKEKLQKQIQGIMGIEDFALHNNFEELSIINKKGIQHCVDEFLKRNIDVNSVEINNDLDKDAIKYSLEPLDLVFDWALLNKINPDGISNWKLLTQTYEYDYDEGTMYKKVMQTADLLGQIKEVAEEARKFSSNADEEKYYAELKETAQEARKLILSTPVHI